MNKKITKFFGRLLMLVCITILIDVHSSQVFAQDNAQITVSGTVKDAKGATIPGATVAVKGTAKVVGTDANGKFKITAQKGESLAISFVGYKTKTVTVTDDSPLQIALVEDDAKTLEDVVVVGYGTQKRTDITGSVASVPKARLEKLPVTNVLQAVQGAVAGVNITTPSSVPGSQPTALVRGQNSITAGTGPFVVVDGVPISKTGGSLNDINPNDIASIEILKDASSTAIYGTNGSNGVILITTKRGTTGKPVIRYNGYAGVENLAHVLKPRSGPEYAQKYADFLKQTGQTQTNPVPNFGELANYNAGVTTDWIKEISQTGVIQDHNVNVSGGTENFKYFIGGGYLDQKGPIKGFQFNRASFRSNLDINVTDFLTIGTSLFYAGNNTDGGRANLLFATAMSPYGQLYAPNGDYKIFPMEPEQLYTNPLLGLVTDRIERTYNLSTNGYAEIKFPGKLSGLKYRLNGGYTLLPYEFANYTGRKANDLIGTATKRNDRTSSYVLENILSYAKDFGKHHIDFTGLYSAQQRRYTRTDAISKDFINDNDSFNNLGAGKTQNTTSDANLYRLNSQMVRINYAYNSKYLFTATARRDGSSVFGSNVSKYGIFPSVAAGWNISSEDFMKNVTFVNNLKLRLSHGKTGNEAVNVYQTISSYDPARSPFNGTATVGVVPNILGNPNLKWESTITTNLGIDFSLLKDRISGTIEVYKGKTSDLILKRAIPDINGYPSVLDNLGKVSNQGLDLTLNTKNFSEGDFKWETGINFSTNKNKIVSLYGDGKDDIANKWFIGKPISVIYDYKLQGVWQTGEDPSKQDLGAKPGDLKFADINGDGLITPDKDRIVQGQTTPKWTGGLTNTFHYKNWNLNVFIQTVQGINRNNQDLNYADETGRRNTPAEIGYWTATNGNNSRPALSYNNTRGYGYPADASFTRIKDVTLSYVFSPKILQKIKLSGLTVYASGRNLYTFTNWIGWDPESSQVARGSDNFQNNYPLTRTFIFGLNVSL